MTDETNKDIEIEDSEEVELPIEETRPLPYAKDQLYLDLLKHYQNADWEPALGVLNKMLEEYPDDMALLEFQNEIQMRLNMQQIGAQADRRERRDQFINISIRALIGLAAVAVIYFIVQWGINLYQDRVDQAQLEREQAALAQTLDSKFENADNFLQAGRVSDALSLFEEIQEIDPEYRDVAEKIDEANSLLALEEIYQQGRAEYLEGDYDSAIDTLQNVIDVDPRYKDAALLLSNIENSLRIEELFAQALEDYENNNWRGVVNSVDEILAIDNTADVSDLDDELFISYMNLVIETAEGGDATIEDVDQAEEYYRAALAIFPQNRDFAQEREELQRVAINLLANKYYIYALELIDQENYSIDSMEEALRLLRKASNIGSGSPAIAAEISQLTTFLTGFENFTGRRWEEAIDNFEQLYRLTPDYADGMLKYLLYETYLARGDTFYSFADYTNARTDYEVAETFAWGDEGNTLRLFQVEIRIGFTLRRISQPEPAAEYYSYALEQVNFSEKLDEDQVDVRQAFDDAESSLAIGDYWNAARLYEILLEDTEFIYEFETLDIRRGDSLAHIAFRYGSSIDTILLYNNTLGDSLIARSNQEIRVPILVEDQN
ncbi:MAG: tetratricopeptide repeat protein [Gammaproteobacteria bacterium]|nr:tetratricopeptide repeat protein [Gammaproteobacteria bacterium]